MHALQYELTLPADYDMGIVRDRVARRGHLLDAWQGLGVKAYLVRERGVHGSPVNQYAPFYLWNTVEGMNAFLWGGGFQGIADDFGRPPVRQWTGLAYEEGVAADAPAAVAVRHRDLVVLSRVPHIHGAIDLWRAAKSLNAQIVAGRGRHLLEKRVHALEVDRPGSHDAGPHLVNAPVGDQRAKR